MTSGGDAAGDARAGLGRRRACATPRGWPPSAAAVWESVLATNAAALRPLLGAVAAELTDLAGRLDDRDAVAALFAAANRYRARFD